MHRPGAGLLVGVQGGGTRDGRGEGGRDRVRWQVDGGEERTREGDRVGGKSEEEEEEELPRDVRGGIRDGCCEGRGRVCWGGAACGCMLGNNVRNRQQGVVAGMEGDVCGREN
ncbi:hypothetical protein E2C01_101174 [Portunus trituberculatus]|uniref:Uncharacterized protein n=1 Tax=Portunus trituberculatus TaxID=210409 RepID=A0A5B7K8W6_PORTR|nr:hypothetical protein [Portunus trituberculatus]